MDFIKTSSLRALIELTFQRNWNGLIWMSRKGVTTKRVNCPDGSIENQRPTAQSGWPRNECSALGQNRIRPTEVSAKVQTTRPITQRPGKHCPAVGQAKRSRHTAHDQSARAGKQASRPRNPFRATADASVRAGKERPTSGREFSSAKSQSARPRRPTANHPTPTVPTRPRPDVRPIVPHDRPNAAVDPKPF
ncbi:unnamed protein product [Microthlaspi erraticum]|uniref:Uncharacterized protein n=1 Tax=Microthlaspi erraticum TaxID=1685480 RepID=A0A6D2I4T6_9BRAS|nr:unnamed protein product [Microthlaspi erraticum]